MSLSGKQWWTTLLRGQIELDKRSPKVRDMDYMLPRPAADRQSLQPGALAGHTAMRWLRAAVDSLRMRIPELREHFAGNGGHSIETEIQQFLITASLGSFRVTAPDIAYQAGISKDEAATSRALGR